VNEKGEMIMDVREGLLYTKSHEWIKMDGEIAWIGLTDFAQSELGNIVFVNLPEQDDSVIVGESFADVESVKAVSDVFSPVSGNVIEINEELQDSPERINEEPYEAWFVKIGDITDKEEFLTASEYEAFLAKENH